jgi:hypothetical protein
MQDHLHRVLCRVCGSRCGDSTILGHTVLDTGWRHSHLDTSSPDALQRRWHTGTILLT